MPMKQICGANKLAANTAALGAVLQLLGIEAEPLETVIARQFKKKGEAVVAENVGIARAGYDYAAQHFKPLSIPGTQAGQAQGRCDRQPGNRDGRGSRRGQILRRLSDEPFDRGAHVDGVTCAPTGDLVRQVEDEIGVMNMVIGAAHAGCRAMCATSGGGFALMTRSQSACRA